MKGFLLTKKNKKKAEWLKSRQLSAPNFGVFFIRLCNVKALSSEMMLSKDLSTSCANHIAK
ncbi:CLUMA_CG021543, isoform A [Clunio marinus]|uniref:CLUMA_CG021543, isoform A n=1 Tax=Clunio marinus TaxID=568069 RepID=A0A1J1J9X5_9DIPT|nr:CLUMA_CG021543, isoform A [Clunio marinus]